MRRKNKKEKKRQRNKNAIAMDDVMNVQSEREIF